MIAPVSLDVETLLAPVAGENPCGEDLRADISPQSLYYRIKDARTAARRIERQIAYGEATTPPTAEWRSVRELASEALAERTRDLELVAYLVEAMVRERGIAGLRDGFQLIRELVEQYWDDLYPLPDEDGVASRIAHVAGLNGIDSEGTLIRPIMMAPLSSGATGEPISSASYQQARQFETLDSREQAARMEDGIVSMDDIDREVQETSPAFFLEMQQAITECLDEFQKMNEVLAEHCGDDAPHSSNIRKALETCSETLQYAAGNRLEAAQAADESEEDTDEESLLEEDAPGTSAADGSAAGNATAKHAGPIRNREEALNRIAEVARFFRETEPHSPLSYAADQLVRWGRLPLPELLSEVITDDHARQSMFTLMGISSQDGDN